MKRWVSWLLGVLIILSFGLINKPAQAAASGKVLELLFNEGSGTTVQDSSGYNNNAKISGASWVKLPTGKWVLSFNGNGNSLKCNYSTSLDISGTPAPLTLEAWVSMSQDKSAMWIGTGGSGGSTGGYALYYHQPFGRVSGHLEGNGDWLAHIYGGTPFGVNIWHHVVYTYDGQRATIYIDGNADGSSDQWTGGMFPISNPFQVYSNFAGMIGEIRVYNYALSQNQIESIYQAERGNYYQLTANTTIYVYPAITDIKVLPTTAIPSQYISNNININSSPGEYRSASFVIYAPNSVSAMTATVSDLTGPAGTISNNAVDLRVVKDWYQAGVDLWIVDGGHKALTPELLLKNDGLVKTEDGKNYVWVTGGSWKWISDPTPPENRWERIPIADESIQDSTILQPVDIPAGTNKQFWITLKIPDNAVAGTYTGTITLSGGIDVINLSLIVLPINLLEPYLIYSIYYTGVLDSDYPQGSISSTSKSETQLNAEMADMINHGVTNPTCFQSLTLLSHVLTIRNNLGLSDKPLYYRGLANDGYQNIPQVQQAISIAQGFGIPDVYFYGEDEAKGAAVTAQRTSWQAIRAAGGKIFAAGYTAADEPPGNYALAGDIQDLLVCYGVPSATEAAQWHSVGHKIFSYHDPQLGLELPETYRRNYGLLLWQQDFDGAMDWAYQDAYGNIWNDFDDPTYRDHVMAYPTIDGVIDTIQWEGFREGVNDVRYLTTLLDAINKAKAAGKNTSAVETWLVNLKSSDLAKVNLDFVRSEMINYILSLQTTQNQPPILNAIGNKTANEGIPLSFTVSATDPDGNPLTYSAANLPSGSSFNASTHTFSWTPSYSQSGIYSSVHFQVSDVSLTDSEDITITVNNINQAPVLAAIGNKSVNAGQLLNFTISATDADGGPLTYSASNLPSGASFNTSTHVFSWTPNSGQAGIYPNVHFQVSDGSLTAYENITITVAQLYAQGDVNKDGAVNVLDMIIIGQNWGRSGTPGWIQADVNADGAINVLDSIIIGQHWTG